MAVFTFCIHRTFDGGEAAVVLSDARQLLVAGVEQHWRDASLARRLRDPLGVFREGIDCALDAWKGLAIDRTIHL